MIYMSWHLLDASSITDVSLYILTLGHTLQVNVNYKIHPRIQIWYNDDDQIVFIVTQLFRCKWN